MTGYCFRKMCISFFIACLLKIQYNSSISINLIFLIKNMENKTKTEALVLIAIILIATAGFGIYIFQKNKKVVTVPPTQNIEQPVVKENIVTESQPQEPQKTEFGTEMPTDFPSNIPVEKGAEVQQSYGLNYDSQKQLSIVFLSTKTVEENFALYKDFLEKQNWNIYNKYESPEISSLYGYGTKESNEINVTISENTSNASAKSQVSISVLKK